MVKTKPPKESAEKLRKVQLKVKSHLQGRNHHDQKKGISFANNLKEGKNNSPPISLDSHQTQYYRKFNRMGSYASGTSPKKIMSQSMKHWKILIMHQFGAHSKTRLKKVLQVLTTFTIITLLI